MATRSTRPSGAPTREQGAPMVDPEAVAAVRRGTLVAVHCVAGASRAVKDTAIVAAKWLAPRLAKGAVLVGRVLWRMLAGGCCWLWAARRGVVRFLHRGLWWAALAILVLCGRALLSVDGNPELVEASLLWFSAGLSMSMLVLIGAPEPRMRVAAFALAGGHGSLAALAWVVVGG